MRVLPVVKNKKSLVLFILLQQETCFDFVAAWHLDNDQFIKLIYSYLQTNVKSAVTYANDVINKESWVTAKS